MSIPFSIGPGPAHFENTQVIQYDTNVGTADADVTEASTQVPIAVSPGGLTIGSKVVWNFSQTYFSTKL